jgi:hypothetical protein
MGLHPMDGKQEGRWDWRPLTILSCSAGAAVCSVYENHRMWRWAPGSWSLLLHILHAGFVAAVFYRLWMPGNGARRPIGWGMTLSLYLLGSMLGLTAGFRVLRGPGLTMDVCVGTAFVISAATIAATSRRRAA